MPNLFEMKRFVFNNSPESIKKDETQFITMAKFRIITCGLLIAANFLVSFFQAQFLLSCSLWTFLALSLIQITIQASPPISGANGKLSYGTLSSYGLVGSLCTNLGERFSDIVCSHIVPSFVNVPINSKNCSRETTIPPQMFHSFGDFCKFFNSACPSAQECLTDRAMEMNSNLLGITDLVIKFGKCCESKLIKLMKFSIKAVLK